MYILNYNYTLSYICYYYTYTTYKSYKAIYTSNLTMIILTICIIIHTNLLTHVCQYLDITFDIFFWFLVRYLVESPSIHYSNRLY